MMCMNKPPPFLMHHPVHKPVPHFAHYASVQKDEMTPQVHV